MEELQEQSHYHCGFTIFHGRQLYFSKARQRLHCAPYTFKLSTIDNHLLIPQCIANLLLALNFAP